MFLVRTHPFNELENFRRQFDQIFNEISDLHNDSTTWKPAIELQDVGENLILKVQLPGWNSQNLDISATREVVTIKGKVPTAEKPENQRIYYSEFRTNSFERQVKLPITIQNDKIQAEYQDGVLILTLPKVVEVVNKVVKVNLVKEGESILPPNSEVANS
jgi:HSP20 family protein